jgi:hypothetical protein
MDEANVKDFGALAGLAAIFSVIARWAVTGFSAGSCAPPTSKTQARNLLLSLSRD